MRDNRSARVTTSLVLALVLLGSSLQAQEAGAGALDLRAHGVRINVLDMRRALEFYGGLLGFETSQGDASTSVVTLKADPNTVLELRRVSNLPPQGANDACPTFTLQVKDLDATLRRLREAKVETLGVKRREGVGTAMTVLDPSGTPISLMQVTVGTEAATKEPAIYNYGFLVPDMDGAREFYERRLGFRARSERYLPLDLPLGHADRSFAFMLHARPGIEAVRFNTPNDQHVVVLFATSSLDESTRALKEKGVAFVPGWRKNSGSSAPREAFYNPFGLLSELVEIKR